MVNEILETYARTGSQEKTAEQLGVTRWKVRQALQEGAGGDDAVEGVVTVDLSHPKPLQDLLRDYGVDPAKWRVHPWEISNWTSVVKNAEGEAEVVPMHRVFARLQPLIDDGMAEELKQGVLDFVAEQGAKVAKRRSVVTVVGEAEDPVMYEIATPDLHFGKLAWAAEAGEDYDLNIAEEGFLDVVDQLLARVKGWNVEKILFIVGNDLLHSDNNAGTTTAGTSVDVDSRHAKVFSRAWHAMVKAIDRMLEVAPVDVVVVPGNHDRDSTFKLGEVLKAWYRSEAQVVVDNAPTLRKYVKYGKTLLGFTHGDSEKEATLPLIMMRENQGALADIQHMEFHLGHLHKKAETRYFAGDTHAGIRIRRLAALTATDAWHAEKGYVKSGRSAEGFLWGRESGYVGHFEVRPS